MVNSDFGDVIAVLLSVSGDRYGYRELQTYLERIESELLRLPAVSKVPRNQRSTKGRTTRSDQPERS